MVSSENFRLRWNDFEANVSSSFNELRAEADFFDVMLACDGSGGRTLPAHKVILSACSPLFKQMLRNLSASSPGQLSPLIYLRGIRLSDLEPVLDFMYTGEVSVCQDDLNSFLAVAEDLQVKGLTQHGAPDAAAASLGSRDSKPAKRAAGGRSRPSAGSAKRAKVKTTTDKGVEGLAAAVKSEPGATGSAHDYDQTAGEGNLTEGDMVDVGGDALGEESFGESYEVGDIDDGGDTGLDNLDDNGKETSGNPPNLSELVSRSLTRVDKEIICKRCGRAYKSRSNASYHVESAHMKLSLPCKVKEESGCQKVFTTRENRDKHSRRCLEAFANGSFV